MPAKLEFIPPQVSGKVLIWEDTSQLLDLKNSVKRRGKASLGGQEINQEGRDRSW